MRVTTRTCARVKILTCSKSPINNFEYEPGHLEHFKIFRPYVSARASCARAAANEWSEIQNFHMIWIPDTNQLTISIHLQSLLTFHKAVRARQSLKSARAAMGNIMQKWAKTCHFLNRNSSRTNRLGSNFYIMVGKSMSWKYDFIPPWLVESANKVIILASKLKKCIFLMTSFLSLFNWDYLAYR